MKEKNSASRLNVQRQHEKVLPQNHIGTLCAIENHFIWLYNECNQQLMKCKSNCKMPKAMWSGMQSPEAWFDECFINLLSYSKRLQKKSLKNSEGNNHIILEQMYTSPYLPHIYIVSEARFKIMLWGQTYTQEYVPFLCWEHCLLGWDFQ